MKCSLWLGALALVCLSRADEVDDLVKKEMEVRAIPGMTLLITRDDKVIKRAAYGMANLENDIPMTVEHVCESGSIGKTFTATVILQLVEEGKLSLDDTLETRLDACPDPWKKLTIRQLLGQTSGLPDYAVVPGLGLIEKWTKADWLAKMPTLPFDFAPGSSWAYSNSNYWLLGFVAEKAGGKPIMDLVRERIIDKLGMKHTYVSDELPIIPRRASGYLRNGQTFLNGPALAPGYGDGSLINSPEDLATFEKGIREGKLLKPETVKMMQTPGRLANGRKTPYGFGWFVREVNKVKLVSHGGNTAGYFASMFHVPSAKLTIILMGNVHDQPGDQIAQKIAELHVPELRPRKLVEAADPDPAMTAKLLDVLKSLAARTPTEELLDPEYAARLKTGRGQMGLGALARYREAAKMAFLEKEADAPDSIYRYRVQAGGKSFVVAFVVTSEGKVYSVGQREE